MLLRLDRIHLQSLGITRAVAMVCTVDLGDQMSKEGAPLPILMLLMPSLLPVPMLLMPPLLSIPLLLMLSMLMLCLNLSIVSAVAATDATAAATDDAAVGVVNAEISADTCCRQGRC